MTGIARKKPLVSDRQLIRQLTRLLQQECQLYREFITLLEEQRRWITKFNADKLEDVNRRRSQLHRQMQTSHAERLILTQQFPESQGKRLSVLIRDHCSRQDQRILLPLLEELRSLVLRSRKIGRDSNNVLSFAMNVVNGSISLLWQASQSVTKSYGRNAKVKESYSPRQSRDENVLKQA